MKSRKLDAVCRVRAHGDDSVVTEIVSSGAVPCGDLYRPCWRNVCVREKGVGNAKFMTG